MVLFGCSGKIESKISCVFYIVFNKLQDTDSKPVKGQEENKNQEQRIAQARGVGCSYYRNFHETHMGFWGGSGTCFLFLFAFAPQVS